MTPESMEPGTRGTYTIHRWGMLCTEHTSTSVYAANISGTDLNDIEYNMDVVLGCQHNTALNSTYGITQVSQKIQETRHCEIKMVDVRNFLMLVICHLDKSLADVKFISKEHPPASLPPLKKPRTV